MTYVLAALAGLAVAAVVFLLFVVRTWVRVDRGDRAGALRTLEEGKRAAVGPDPAAQGEFLYRYLGDIATVDYEKDERMQESVARVLQRVPGTPPA